MHLECDSNTILHLIGNLKLSFHYSLIQTVNLTSLHFFLQAISLYSGRGSTNCMADWYGKLAEATKAPIRAAGFEPIVRLLLERSANAILVQSLAEKWWDTTPTFHIAKREITVTPSDFHRMTSLRHDDTIINLEGELGTWLVIDLLGRRYSLDTICYFDIKADYRPLPQETVVDCAWMARAFLLYILGAYLFANGGQTVSLRWLALFRNFEVARVAN